MIFSKYFASPLLRRYKDDIWLSELASAGFLAAYCIGFIMLIVPVLFCTAYLHRVEKNVALVRGERSELKSRLDSVETRAAIYQSIQHLRKGKLRSRHVLALTDIVAENSAKFGYDPLILLAVIYTESMFEQDALGQKRSGEYSGAIGLMQLKFETAKEMARKVDIELASEEDLFNPEKNIPLGIYYLTRMVVEFNSLPLGILAYNQGPETIRRGVNERSQLSKRYYDKVMQHYYRLKKETKV